MLTVTSGTWTDNQTITHGSCSLCGGDVVGPQVIVTDGFGKSNARIWCAKCGAVPKPVTKYTVIEMVKP